MLKGAAMSQSPVSLETFAQGALKERFEDALSQVVENIYDLNTEPTTVREISITIKIKPSESREMAGVRADVKTKLAPHKGIGTAFYMGTIEGEFIAVENNPRQLGFDEAVKKVKEDTASVQ
jgi:hypothetical protein